MNEDALTRLALAAGIEPGYWDGLGRWRPLEAATAIRVLREMGLDPDANLEAQCRDLTEAAFASPLPASQVVRAGSRPTLPVSLSADDPAALDWRLELEHGQCLTGHSEPAGLPPAGEGWWRGAHRRVVALTLPLDIPAGYHTLKLRDPVASTVLIAAPERCYIPDDLAGGARRWGIAVQLYSVRSSRNWGIGDFTDLQTLAVAAAQAGASFIGLNPLHAKHLAEPERASPYAPSSRLFLDPLYIDVEALPELGECGAARASIARAEFAAACERARQAPRVDYVAVAALKLPVLQMLFESFDSAAAASDRAASSGEPAVDVPEDGEFQAFVRSGGERLARFAEFEAWRLDRRQAGADCGPQRPAACDSGEMAAFRRNAARQIRFQMWLQWRAAGQLDAATACGRAAGLSLGLYKDLAVGSPADGAEVWSGRGLAACGASIGAPPDLLSAEGQDWGLPPWNPRELAARAWRPFAELLDANMRNAGALRVDHVMALLRLYWVPVSTTGAHGAYVRYDFDTLTAVLALESLRHRCMVIGEDLGSVPDGLRDRLQAAGILSYRVLRFERHWKGDRSFCRPWEYPPQSIATVVTHDMPTIAEFWSGGDIGRRSQLNRMRHSLEPRGQREPEQPGSEQRERELEQREGEQREREEREREQRERTDEKNGLLALLGETGLSPADPQNSGQVIEALHAVVARTASMLAVVQIDDLIGEVEPVNIPGTDREYANWTRKLALPLEDIIRDPRWSRLGEIMRAAGRAGVRA